MWQSCRVALGTNQQNPKTTRFRTPRTNFIKLRLQQRREQWRDGDPFQG
jgi:hypothetical protein